MQTLNCLLALGGDRATTAPKYGITPAEVRILQHLHGDDAVFDVEPADEIDIAPRALRDDLVSRFPARKDEDRPIFDVLFPRAADAPETVEDLGLHDEFFKVLERVSAKPKAKRAKAAVDPFDDKAA